MKALAFATLCAVTLVVVGAFAGACATGGKGGGGPADPARGQKYFQVKCNSCHPSGGQGAGPALIGKMPPGPLKKSSSGGRHNVPAAEYDSLMAYLTPMMQPQAAAAAAAAAAAPAAPAGGAVAPTAPAGAAAAPAPGMKTCNCTCQCPVGTPPGQMQNCTCACACPPG